METERKTRRKKGTEIKMEEWMKEPDCCTICPRECGVNRTTGNMGVCHADAQMKIARAALHFWEEPCISGKEGSGAIFFSGCALGCVFCQNMDISRGQTGKKVTEEQLALICLNLQAQGANNINLVTAGQYLPAVAKALKLAREQGLEIPVVYNSSGYEKPETLQLLDGLVDIYLPDMKYMDAELAKKYSHAEDYPKVAKAALAEMVRQCPDIEFDERGMMKKGVIVRHLLLPGHVKDSKAVLEYLFTTYQNQIYISIMSQYTPMPQMCRYPELNRRVTKREYERLLDYAVELGIEHGFFQEGDPVGESFIPEFDGEGVPG